MIRMCFGVEWLGWMEALVFNSSMSIIVNVSPMKNFKVTKGLQQGDPIFSHSFPFGYRGINKINT